MRTAVVKSRLVWAVAAGWLAAAAAQEDATLSAGGLEVCVSRATGDLTQVRWRGRDMLAAPATLELKVWRTPGAPPVRLSPGKVLSFTAKPALVAVVRQWGEARTSSEVTVTEEGVRWLVSATGPAPVRELAVEYVVPCLRGAERVFWAAIGAPWKASDRPLGFKYGFHAELPLATVYSETDDAGLTVAAPLELRKPDLNAHLDWAAGTLRFYYRHLRLGEPYEAKVGLWLLGHAGCWRPALAWLLRRYPSYFESHPRLLAGEGLYQGAFLRCDPSGKAYPQRWREAGISWVESHSFWPFYGLYIPDKDPWRIILPKDKKTPEDFAAWEQGKEPGMPMSRQWIRDYIRAFHDGGIQYYSYLNDTEAWLPYADKYFADSIVRRMAAPLYGGMAVLNAYEGTSWGKHIREQFRRTVECFPEQDGVFLDQNCYRGFHFGADDGVSMRQGKLCCQISFAQEQMLEHIHKLTTPLNMAVWTNMGSVGVECARYVHGIMSEAGRPRPQRLQYLCAARPLVIGAHDLTAKGCEERLKMCLSCGAFPAPWQHKEPVERLRAKYLPLLEMLKGRRWLLNAHAVRLPDGVEGNAFSVPNGDVLVPFISPRASQVSPGRTPFQHSLPVTVRVPDPAAIRCAYLRSGDWFGAVDLPLRRNGLDFELTVPAHLASSLIVLTHGAPPPLVRTSPPVLSAGRTNRIALRLRGAPQDATVRLTTPWGTSSAQAKAEAEGACVAEFAVAVPAAAPTDEVDFSVAVAGADAEAERFSAWVEPDAAATCERFVFVKDGSATLGAAVANHTDQLLEVALAAAPPGIVTPPGTLQLRPYEQRRIGMPVRDVRGPVEVRLTATSGARRILDAAVALRAPRLPQPGDLFHDPFVSGMRGWQVRMGKWACADGAAAVRGPAHLAVLERPDWRDYGVQVTVKMDGSTDPGTPWIKCYVFLRMDEENSFVRYGFVGQVAADDGLSFKRLAVGRCRQGKYVGRSEGGNFPYRAGEWYVLGAEIVGKRFRGYVDGRLVVETDMPDDIPRAGGIGIGVTEDSMVNHYRDLIAYPIGAE